MKLKTEDVVVLVVVLLLLTQPSKPAGPLPGQYNTGIANDVGFVF